MTLITDVAVLISIGLLFFVIGFNCGWNKCDTVVNKSNKEQINN